MGEVYAYFVCMCLMVRRVEEECLCKLRADSLRDSSMLIVRFIIVALSGTRLDVQYSALYVSGFINFFV